MRERFWKLVEVEAVPNSLLRVVLTQRRQAPKLGGNEALEHNSVQGIPWFWSHRQRRNGADDLHVRTGSEDSEIGHDSIAQCVSQPHCSRQNPISRDVPDEQYRTISVVDPRLQCLGSECNGGCLQLVSSGINRW